MCENVCGYARVSTGEQNEGRQLLALSVYAIPKRIAALCPVLALITEDPDRDYDKAYQE